jgi:hypothetical protein
VVLQLGGWARCWQLTIKIGIVTKDKPVPLTWTTYYLVRPKQWKRGKRCGSWNVRSLYRSGSLITVARELARYKLELADVQEVLGRSAMKVEAALCFFQPTILYSYTVQNSSSLCFCEFKSMRNNTWAGNTLLQVNFTVCAVKYEVRDSHAYKLRVQRNSNFAFILRIHFKFPDKIEWGVVFDTKNRSQKTSLIVSLTGVPVRTVIL